VSETKRWARIYVQSNDWPATMPASGDDLTAHDVAEVFAAARRLREKGSGVAENGKHTANGHNGASPNGHGTNGHHDRPDDAE